MERFADLYKALADETRLQMLVLLLEREELCVCDFVGALGITQSKASRHLRYLYHTGLLADRRDGVWMRYRIAQELGTPALQLLHSFFENVPPATRQDLLARLDEWFAHKPDADIGSCCT